MKQACVVLVLVLAYLAQSEAVRCWTCSGKNIWDCNIIDDQKECDGECMKSVVGDLVDRSCSPYCLDANAGGQGVFCCNSFLCNAATITSSSSSLVVLASAAIVALLYNRM